MKKGKEFIFPENVDKDYGIWKDYNLRILAMRRGRILKCGITLSWNAAMPMASGHILVRRNRDVTLGNRALLSPNDWKETNQFQDEFVLTLYQVFGEKNNGRSVWVPNIKLPMKKNFYII